MVIDNIRVKYRDNAKHAFNIKWEVLHPLTDPDVVMGDIVQFRGLDKFGDPLFTINGGYTICLEPSVKVKQIT